MLSTVKDCVFYLEAERTAAFYYFYYFLVSLCDHAVSVIVVRKQWTFCSCWSY
jgi:hypothetical protein